MTDNHNRYAVGARKVLSEILCGEAVLRRILCEDAVLRRTLSGE
jgi:hypothetical protein